jgi:predicted amidophosphoribosyltransferase
MVLVKPVLDNWQIKAKVDIIIPIPPSDISRTTQPVFIIAEAISNYLKIPMSIQVLKKLKHEQLKNASTDKKFDLIKGSIIKDKNFKKKVNILLVDDLFDSGATLNEAVDVLKSDINVADVYVLTMTKTGRR